MVGSGGTSLGFNFTQREKIGDYDGAASPASLEKHCDNHIYDPCYFDCQLGNGGAIETPERWSRAASAAK